MVSFFSVIEFPLGSQSPLNQGFDSTVNTGDSVKEKWELKKGGVVFPLVQRSDQSPTFCVINMACLKCYGPGFSLLSRYFITLITDFNLKVLQF